MKRTKALTRGGVAKLVGCNLETIRYYEKIGLIPEPMRSAGGHRVYDESLVRRLKFIRRGRELGFSQADLRDLLGLVDGDEYACADVKAMTEQHLDGVRAKIADLRIIEHTLQVMVAECADTEVPDCPVIDALFDDDGAGPSAPN
ncbi:MAG: helix-turn-helix domain-containing protein [Alphaproteobacteria bacterium]